MANTMTNSVDGVLYSEDFAGQADDAVATSVDFSFTSPAGENFLVDTIVGKKCIKTSAAVPTRFVYTADGIYVSVDLNKLIMQADQCLAKTANGYYGWETNGSATVIKRMYTTGNDKFLQTGAGAYNNIGATGDFTTTWSQAANTWYNRKETFSDTYNNTTMILDSTGVVLNREVSFGYSQATPTGAGDKWFYAENYGSNTWYIANLLIMSDWDVIFDGDFVDGMAVNFLDGSDNILYTIGFDGVTETWDTRKLNPYFPYNVKMQIIGTDGSTLLTTALSDIHGGDTWTYAGDTSTASLGKKRISAGDFK